MFHTSKSFLPPLSPAIERDTLARRDGWSGEDQSGALAVIQLTSRLVLQSSSYDFTCSVHTERDLYSVRFPPPFLRL